MRKSAHILQILLVFIFSLFFNKMALAQDVINTDRPDQSDGAYVLSKNNWQLETGFVFSREKNTSQNFTHTTMVRYGVHKGFELRFLVDEGLLVDKITGTKKGVLYPASLSTKISLIQEKGILPAVTAVGYLKLPFTASKLVKPTYYAATFLLAFQNTITDKVGLGYNVGFKTDELDGNVSMISTASLGFEVAKNINTFAEYFADYSRGSSPNHNIDIGVLYLVNNRFQIDVAAGTSLFNQGNIKFITTGISYKF